MTPQEKAIDLYNKFNDYADCNYGGNKFEQNWFGYILAGERKVRKESTKQCALIAVDEILHITCLKDFDYKQYFNSNSEFINYWEEVKIEIEKL